MSTKLAVILGMMVTASGAGAQAPPGWKVRADDPKADMTKLAFTEMKPGFHVTTGTLAFGAAVALLLTVASGIFPAWQAAKLPVVQALRRVE